MKLPHVRLIFKPNLGDLSLSLSFSLALSDRAKAFCLCPAQSVYQTKYLDDGIRTHKRPLSRLGTMALCPLERSSYGSSFYRSFSYGNFSFGRFVEWTLFLLERFSYETLYRSPAGWLRDHDEVPSIRCYSFLIPFHGPAIPRCTHESLLIRLPCSPASSLFSSLSSSLFRSLSGTLSSNLTSSLPKSLSCGLIWIHVESIKFSLLESDRSSRGRSRKRKWLLVQWIGSVPQYYGWSTGLTYQC